MLRRVFSLFYQRDFSNESVYFRSDLVKSIDMLGTYRWIRVAHSLHGKLKGSALVYSTARAFTLFAICLKQRRAIKRFRSSSTTIG